ncbi:unnamed protein product [Schistocephalus solidus]|uniref:WW domain-containing protein n=1 Tax=Schistocephalus solidus TaxID=70667 RepID=A0A183T5S4_SCHSO|nr:unnamed protein product [Schistocephalus solidus]
MDPWQGALPARWVAAQAPTGEQYFYEPQSRVSVWELPDLTSLEDGETQELSTPHPVTSSAAPVTRMSTSFTRGSILGAPPESSVISTIDLSEAQAKFGARQQPSPSATPKGSGFTFFGDKKRHSTDSLDQAGTIDEADGRFSVQRISRDHITGPLENKLRATERRGLVNRTKLSVNGERLTKKWIPSLLVLVGPTLYVYKDVKGQKINLQPSKPELQMQVKNLVIEVADSSCTGRDNCLLVRDTTDSSNVVEYLFQAPSLLLRKAWETAFQYSQNWVQEDRFAQLAFSRKHPPSVDSKIITMLQNFFRIRPSLETLRARGILKNEPVFASVLCELCAREQTKVPTFVTRVIGAIEARGLNVPGLYRKSGNAATIQNLRNQVNHYDYSLNSDEWGVFELSDSLKLFLRELKEPLFCYSIYGCLSKPFLLIAHGRHSTLLVSLATILCRIVCLVLHKICYLVKDQPNILRMSSILTKLLKYGCIINCRAAYFEDISVTSACRPLNELSNRMQNLHSV